MRSYSLRFRRKHAYSRNVLAKLCYAYQGRRSVYNPSAQAVDAGKQTDFRCKSDEIACTCILSTEDEPIKCLMLLDMVVVGTSDCLLAISRKALQKVFPSRQPVNDQTMRVQP